MAFIKCILGGLRMAQNYLVLNQSGYYFRILQVEKKTDTYGVILLFELFH